MLDISFSELVVCLLVALIVLGPERLPGAARAVGRWTGKARAYMRTFTAELEREAQLSEIRKQLEETQRILREQSSVLQRSAQELSSHARALPETLKAELNTPPIEHSAEPQDAPEKPAPKP